MKTVLITGASKGIGRATAIAFAKKGYSVGINYNKSLLEAENLKNQLIDLGADAEIFNADVSKPESAKALADNFIKRFGHIDVLVNNAGISNIKPINEVGFEDWDTIISTNLSSAFYLTKSLLPCFINVKSGCIINIASIWGEVGASCEVAYSASKAGLIGFTKALSKELGPSGIRVNSISPGIINTDMITSISEEEKNSFIQNLSIERIGTPEEIADVAVFLSSDKSKYITGQNISVNGGY